MRARSSLLAVAALASCTAAGCHSTAPRSEPPSTTVAPETASSPVTVLGATVTLTPKRVAVTLRLRQPANVDPPIASTARITLPKGISWHGTAVLSCDLATLRRGIDRCPKAATIGAGTALGIADRSETVGEITVVNGANDHVYLATTVRHPAYVKTIVPGTITTSEQGLRLALTFPPDLQTIAGVPVGLQQLRLAIDRQPTVVTAACPTSGWAYDATVTFADGTHAQHGGTAACS